MQIEHFINQIDLTLDPPAEEPLRQYYFIAKARTLVAQMEKEAGRKMTFCVNTFGCQMNARDSEKLCGILNAIGYQESESEDADFVIYNTCTVRENANNKVYGRLGYLHGYKKKNPHMMIALCGCMMQEEKVVAKIKQSYRFVDLIFGTHNIFKFAELLVQSIENNKRSSVKLKTLWRMVLWKLCCLDRMSILMERIWINQLLLHSFWSRLNRLRDWNGSGL